jgi:hypothetical protein
VSIESRLATRHIEEVLHFTTSNGLVGIMSAGSLFSHARLPAERQLSHILQINCSDRSRDQAWHGYVNLSISRVNSSFFDIARNRWHATKDLYWCVLGFDPEILTHEGVLFSTTNNAYDATIRASGEAGLEALFAPAVRQFPTKVIYRSQGLSGNLPTCSQAEALYPEAVPVRYLRRVYVPSDDIANEAEAQIAVCAPALSEKFQLVVDPSHFR